MLEHQIKQIVSVDIFSKGQAKSLFVGRPYYLDYEKIQILVSDAWKHQVKGIPQGAFLLAFYNGEEDVQEVILLRVL